MVDNIKVIGEKMVIATTNVVGRGYGMWIFQEQYQYNI